MAQGSVFVDAVFSPEVGWNLCAPNRQGGYRHPINMLMRLLSVVLLACGLALYPACTSENPDQLREKTAEETARLKRDTKAVAQGVKEGLSNKRSLDLNSASRDDLASLPGLNTRKAERIIAERPYANPHQLVTRRVLTEDEFAQIQDRVEVKR